MIRDALLTWITRSQSSRPGSRGRRCRRPRGLEGLEDRVLLSGNPTVYTVDLLSDTGTGSGTTGDLL
jgi:hypothetical protein